MVPGRLLPLLAAGSIASPVFSQDVAVPGIPGSGTEPAAPVERVRIDPQFVIGQTYRYLAHTEVRAQLPDHGIRGLSLEQQVRYVVSPRIDEKPGVRIEGRTERLAVKVQSAGVTLEYDSFEAEDRGSRFGQHLQPGLRETIEIKVNRDNRVVEEDSPIASLGEPDSPGEVPCFGPGEMKELLALLLQGGSGKPVGFGETWTLDGVRTVGDLGEVSFSLIYRHEGAADYEGHSCERVTVSGTLSGQLPGGVPGADQPAAGDVKFEGGSLGGEILYDPVLRTYRFFRQSISLLLDVPPADPETAPRRIAIEQSTSSKLLHRVATP